MGSRYSGVKFKWFICEVCGRDFTAPAHKNRRFCGYRCMNEWQSKTREYPCGEDNPHWKGGVTPIVRALRASKDYAEWRQSVLSRDGFKCVSCGMVGKRLHAHHIIQISQDITKSLDIDNGVTLCKKCHQREHPEVRLFWGD